MTKHFVIVNKDEPDFRFRELGFSTSRENTEKLLENYKKLYKFENLEIEEHETLKLMED